MNLLIIEDDINFANQIKKVFLSKGYANIVEHFSNYNEFICNSYKLKSFDIILLDINLRVDIKEEGFSILKNIRLHDKQIPVIIISSHSEYGFLERAFSRGANDYLIKPFRSRELQIRIQRWFHNYILSEYYTTEKKLMYYDITYNISEYQFYISGVKIELTKGSKHLLSLLIIYKEKLVLHSFLVEKIWGFSDKDFDKNLRIKIMRLKKQLEKFGYSSWIQTIRGQGYKLMKP